MNEARMSTKRDYDEALRIYHEGHFGLKPQKEVSASSKHLKDRDKILMLGLKLPHVLPAWERISLLTNIETGKP